MIKLIRFVCIYHVENECKMEYRLNILLPEKREKPLKIKGFFIIQNKMKICGANQP